VQRQIQNEQEGQQEIYWSEQDIPFQTLIYGSSSFLLFLTIPALGELRWRSLPL
jgi:hypothetical protein